MKFLIATTVLILFCSSAFAAGPDFLFSQVEGQPLVIVQALPNDKAANDDTIVIVENRSNRIVKDFWMVLAGHSCINKPLWPMIRYSDTSKPSHNTIEPGGRAEIRIAKKLIRQTEAVAVKTCGEQLPSELAISRVDFADGTTWTLGEAVRTSSGRQRNVQPYGFVHHETTGITSYIILNGKETPVRFRLDSDTMAVKSFHALKRILTISTGEIK